MTLTVIQDSIIPVFAAYSVNDEYSRSIRLLSLHRTKEDAEVACHRQGYYGGPGKVLMKHAIQDGDKLYLLEDFKVHEFSDVTEKRLELEKIKLSEILGKLSESEVELLKRSLV